jgi:hypothetical protein
MNWLEIWWNRTSKLAINKKAAICCRCNKETAMQNEIPFEYQGWWRIIETSRWDNNKLDIMGTALITLTGNADRLRMFTLLAYVNCKLTKSGVSFTWEGTWEYDPMSGSGRVTLGKDGRLKGVIKIAEFPQADAHMLSAFLPWREPSYCDAQLIGRKRA